MFHFKIQPKAGLFFASRCDFCVSYFPDSCLGEIVSFVLDDQIYLKDINNNILYMSCTSSFLDNILSFCFFLKCPVFKKINSNIVLKRVFFKGDINSGNLVIKNSNSSGVSGEMFFYEPGVQSLEIFYSGIYVDYVVAISSFLFLRRYLTRG